MVNQAELLFSEVLNALSQISEKRCKIEQNNSGMKLPESRRQIAEFESMLQKEKAEFEVRLSMHADLLVFSYTSIICEPLWTLIM